MYVRTTKPQSPWQNNSESFINIIEVNSNRRKVQRNIPNNLWDFGVILEDEIYSWNTVKYGLPALEILTGDTIDIYEWI